MAFSADSSTYTPSVSATVNSLTDFSISLFTVSSSSSTVGSALEFSISITNIGNSVQTVESYIQLYKDGVYSENLTISNVTLAGGESATILKSWTSSATGSYEAVAYSAGDVIRNSTVSFSVVSSTQPSAPFESSDRKAKKAPEIIEIIKTVQTDQKKGVFDFLTSFLFVEASPGDNLLLYSTVRSEKEEGVSMKVVNKEITGSIPTSSDSKKSSPEKYKETFLLPLNIPNNVSAGYYYIKSELFLENSITPSISQPIVVKVSEMPAASRFSGPSVTRSINVNREKNSTTITLDIKNTKNEMIPHMEYYEKISKEFARSAKDIKFQIAPTAIINDDPEVRWDFYNVEANKTLQLSYELNKTVDDYESFVNWQKGDTVLISGTPDEKVSIVSFNSPVLYAGNTSDVSFDIFNADGSQKTVSISIIPPAGWKANPNSFSVNMLPRDNMLLYFKLAPPEDASIGTYAITARLNYDERIIDKQYTLFVNGKPEVIYEDIRGFRLEIPKWVPSWVNRYTVVGFIVALLLLYILVRFTIKSLSSSKYSNDRQRYLKMVTDSIKGDKNGK